MFSAHGVILETTERPAGCGHCSAILFHFFQQMAVQRLAGFTSDNLPLCGDGPLMSSNLCLIYVWLRLDFT